MSQDVQKSIDLIEKTLISLEAANFNGKQKMIFDLEKARKFLNSHLESEESEAFIISPIRSNDDNRGWPL